jgi:acetoacetyl-CoA synthetase
MSNETTLLWTPSESLQIRTNLHHYMQWLRNSSGKQFTDYHQLWTWSIEQSEEFWKTIWDYFDIQYSGKINAVLSGNQMPHYSWFDGTSLNYAEHVFRKSSGQRPAIIFADEQHATQTMSWKQLENEVSSLQQYFQSIGIAEGDRVAAYLPCIPEATTSFLATSSLGAIWSSCSPDFGLQAVIDRFVQIDPKVLIAVDQYAYNGKRIDRSAILNDLIKALPSLRQVILINPADTGYPADQFITWHDVLQIPFRPLTFNRVPFNHPLWILYSSGTTGLPKSIAHSQGGILLEHLKYLTFHNDIKEGDHCFWYTTTGWMMWNYIQSSLLCGGVLVLYDGSPAYPDLNRLWKFIDEAQINHFGTSAAFIMTCRKNGIEPSSYNLSHLKSISSTGSTLPAEGFEWVYTQIKKDVWLASISGGTDVCSAFVGGNPLWPVHRGEIQCRALGCRLEAYDEDGKPVQQKVGELVVTKPMPSMPVFFWNDPDFIRYRESYFETYPGVWRHGDWIEITQHKGIIIFGRSDATLNRGGVRMGTSEIYRALDTLPEITDSLMVCIEKSGGEFWMPLFVVLKSGTTLNSGLADKIKSTLRELCSPRHVPDTIHAVQDIPYTISGKKTEMPVKKILMGQSPEKAVNTGSLRNPESLTGFLAIAKDVKY